MSTPKQFYEGCGREGPIRCIFLSEFHPVAGSKINFQVPEGFISKEKFDAMNVYIIPKPSLQRCVMTVNAMEHKIVGYPVRIDDQRYARNAYYFNLCFVCEPWARSVQYEPVVKKLAEYFIMMEDETGFLSRERDNEIGIQKVLTKVLRDLNEKRMTTIVEGETTIYLQILTPRPDPPHVMDHMVPLLSSEYENMPSEVWDLTTQQILTFIDGFNHIARISAEADVESTLVKACIQNLAYYGVIRLLPLLKYSNVYMCTRNLQTLTTDNSLYHLCRKYVCLTNDLPRPTLPKVLQLYSSMTHGLTLRSLCQRLSPREHNIDEKKLVTFGLLHNLIRCINKFPIFTGSVPTGRQKLYTGLHTLDEICCKTGLSPSKIEEDIDSDTNVTVIWK